MFLKVFTKQRITRLVTRRLHIRMKLVIFAFILLATFQAQTVPSIASSMLKINTQNTLSSRSISLDNRYSDAWVNSVFADNILLNLSYMRGKTVPGQPVAWEEARKPFEYSFTLESQEVFAYHEDTLPTYPIIKQTTNAHFNGAEGFKSDGYLMGDGVCHLASLFYWAAKDAGLEAVAPTNHNFAVIPDIPAEYGVAIYFMPGSKNSNAAQNLYIKNNKDKPVVFKVAYQGNNLSVSVY